MASSTYARETPHATIVLNGREMQLQIVSTRRTGYIRSTCT